MRRFVNNNFTLYERIVIQMTKLVRECESEGYNAAFLEEPKKILQELRNSMRIQRVCSDGVEYKDEKDGVE